MIRKIYVNPGEMFEIRIMQDEGLPKNAMEWKYQISPRSFIIIVHNHELIELADPTITLKCMGKYR